jgi:tRNA (guanine-N7-)-methyltransferase
LSSPAPIIYPLGSIVEALDLAQLFAKAQPLEVELGSGDGSFLAQYAALHPERNFIGVERLLGRLRKLERKCQRAGIAHVRAIRIEASYFLEWLLPRKGVTALHIYFPDPWPKRKHRKNRLVNERFTQLAHAVLAAGGVVYLRTDDADYFAQMEAVFGASPLFKPTEIPTELIEIQTDFERGFRQKGIATLRAAYQKVD